MVRSRAGRENNVFLSGKFGGIDIAYLDTQRDLGVVLEVFSGFPAADKKPHAT